MLFPFLKKSFRNIDHIGVSHSFNIFAFSYSDTAWDQGRIQGGRSGWSPP